MVSSPVVRREARARSVPHRESRGRGRDTSSDIGQCSNHDKKSEQILTKIEGCQTDLESFKDTFF